MYMPDGVSGFIYCIILFHFTKYIMYSIHVHIYPHLIPGVFRGLYYMYYIYMYFNARVFDWSGATGMVY